MSRNSAGVAAIVGILAIVAALAVGNLILFADASFQLSGQPPAATLIDQAASLYARLPDTVTYLAGAHASAAILAVTLLLILWRRAASGPETHASVEAAPAVDPASALQLLALLQAEGRLIDFLEEDIDPYTDTQVGAAVRSIHAGCRKALHERMTIERIHAAEDGTEIDVPRDYDPSAIRLTGHVHGQPPFRGTLQHSGWRASGVTLPQPGAGADAGVLAPAEVEIS